MKRLVVLLLPFWMGRWSNARLPSSSALAGGGEAREGRRSSEVTGLSQISGWDYDWNYGILRLRKISCIFQ